MKTGNNIFTQNNNSKPSNNIFLNSNNSSSQNLLSPNNPFARNSQNTNIQNLSNNPNVSNQNNTSHTSNTFSNNNGPNVNKPSPNVVNNSNPLAANQTLHIPPKPQIPNQLSSLQSQNYPEVVISFSSIYKKMLQGVTISTAEQQFIKEGGQYFQTGETKYNEEKKKLFDATIKDKDHIGFGFRERLISGDIPKSKYVDQIWIKLIKHFAYITQSNQMVGYELIKKEVPKRKLYEKFYSPVLALNNKVFKLNQEEVQKFYVIVMPQQQNNQSQGQQQNQTKVDIQNLTYKQILQSMTSSYFKQYLSYLDILCECFRKCKSKKDEKVGIDKNQSFKKLVNYLIKSNIIKDLWIKYKALWKIFSNKNKIIQPPKNQARSVNESPSKNNNLNKSQNQLLQKVILLFKKKIFEYIGSLILEVLQNCYVNQRIAWEQPIQIIQLLEFIANDNLHCDITLKLLLKLFPWKSFSSIYKRQSQQMSMGLNKQAQIPKLSNDKKKEILNLTLNIQDDRFIGFKMIPDFLQYKQRRRDRPFQGIPWDDLLESETWNMFGSQWRYWLGLLLQYIPQKQIFQNKELSNHILQLCKTSVCLNLEQFWEIKNFDYRQIFIYQSFDLYLIGRFLKSYSNEYGLQYILPILTKALKSFDGKDYCHKVVDFVGQDQMKIIIEPIREILDIKMFGNQQSQQSKEDTNINFEIQDVEPNIQQELKFISKFVSIKINQLSYLQSVLFSGQYQEMENRVYKQNQYGLKIMSFLLIALNKIDKFNVSSIKCIRYIVKTLDCLFCYEHTRKTLLFLMSLFFSQLYAQNNNKVFQLVNLCMMTTFKGQMKRQAQKLRFTFSNHLCNMLRFSDCISDYFKIGQCYRSNNFQNKSQLLTILQYISKEQYEYVEEYLSHEFQVGQFNWFFDILRLLQHKNLFPIDYQNIYLILQKMRIKNLESQQAICMREVLQILNQSTISAQIFQCIRPQYKKGEFFYLSNFDIMSFFKHDSLEPENIQQRTIPKYKNEFYSRRKLKKTIIKEKNSILGRLNGSLRVIQTILKLKYQGDYQILDQLSLSKQIYQKLTQKKHLVNYKIHTVDYEYHQWQTNIHLALSSYLNLDEDAMFFQFGQRSAIPFNRIRNIHIPILITTDGAIGFKQKYINSQFFQNIMHSGIDLVYTSDYSIKGNVLRIYQLLFLLGKGSVIKNSLNNREWSNEYQLYQNQAQFGKNVEKLIKKLIQMLSLDKTTIIVCTQILELIILMLNQEMFLEKLIDNLIQLKNSLEKILQKILKNPSSILYIRILSISAYLIYNLVSVNSSNISNESEVQKASNKFEYDYIKRFMEYPSNILIDLTKCIKKMGRFEIGKVYDGDDIFSNYYLQIKTNRSTLFKTTFHIILKIFSLYFSNLTPSTIIQFIQLILPQTKNFVMQPPNTIFPRVASKINLFQKNPLRHSQELYNLTAWQFPFNHFNKILSQYFNSYGENYQYDYFTAFSRLKYNKKLQHDRVKSEILSLQRTNCLTGLWHSHVYMIETFVYVLLKILKLGPYGYSMSNYFVDESLPSDYIDQIKGDKFFTKGRYDSLSLMGKNQQQQYKNLLFLFKTFLEYLQFNGKMYVQEPINLISAFQKQQKMSKNKQTQYYKNRIKPSLDSCILLLNEILSLMIKTVPQTMNFIQNLQVIGDLRDRLFIYLCGQLTGCTLRVLLLAFNSIVETDLKLQQLKKKFIYEHHQSFNSSFNNSLRDYKHTGSIFQERKNEYVINQIPLLQQVANILTCGLHNKVSYRKIQRSYNADDILGNCMLFSTLCQTILHKLFQQFEMFQQKNIQAGLKRKSKNNFSQTNKQSFWDVNRFQLRNTREKLMMIQNIIYQLLENISMIDEDFGRRSIINLAGNFIQLMCKIETTVEKGSKFRFFQKFLNSVIIIVKDLKTNKIQRTVCFNILQGLLIYDNGEVCKRVINQFLDIMNIQTFFQGRLKSEQYYAVSQAKNEEIYLKNQRKQHQKIYKLRQSTNSYSTLTDLFQLNGLLGLICSFMTHEQNWSSLSKDNQILDQFFIQVLFQDILMLDSSKIVPTSKGEFKAKQVIIYQKKPRSSFSLDKQNYHYTETNRIKNEKKKKGISSNHVSIKDSDYFFKPNTITSYSNESLDLFTFIANLKISEIVLFQLLIIKQGIQKSGRFRDLIKKTLRTKNQQINSQKMWKILQTKIVKFCQFYNSLVGLFQSQSLIENMIKIYNYTCKQASYWTNFEGLTFLFNQYNQEQFYYHIVQSIIVLGECCLQIYNEWKDVEWEYMKDWRTERNEMMAKTYQLFKKISIFVSLKMKQNLDLFEKVLKELKQGLKQQLMINK